MANLFPRKRREESPLFSPNSMFPQIFDDYNLSDFFNKDLMNDTGMPQVDIEDKGDHYELTADLPGFNKDQVVVEYDSGYLTIKGEQEHSEETKDEEKHYIRKERSYGSFQRSFYVGDINEEYIKGKFKDGVLLVSVPKSDEEEKKRGKRIELE